MTQPDAARVERGPITEVPHFALGMAALLERQGFTVAANELRRLHAENERLRAQRDALLETSAERTLKRLGYTDCGGEFWKPPLGAPAEPVQEPQCNPHPKAPHGFLRNASHNADRYVCECDGWEPYEAGYQAGMEAALRAQS